MIARTIIKSKNFLQNYLFKRETEEYLAIKIYCIMPPPSDQDNSTCPFQTGENHRGKLWRKANHVLCFSIFWTGPDALERTNPTIPLRNVAGPSPFQATTSKSQQDLAETSASASKSQHGLAETDDSLRIAQEVEKQVYTRITLL